MIRFWFTKTRVWSGPRPVLSFMTTANRRESSRRRLGKVSMGPADPESGMGAIYSSDSLDPLAATEAGRLFDGPLQRVPHRSVASGAGSLLEFCPRHSAGNAETANQGCVSGNACGDASRWAANAPGQPTSLTTAPLRQEEGRPRGVVPTSVGVKRAPSHPSAPGIRVDAAT